MNTQRIESVGFNNRKREFEVVTGGRLYNFPYAKADLVPAATDRVVSVAIDEECASEMFEYRLDSGARDWVHVEQVLEYHHDPAYFRDLLLYRLTAAALDAIEGSGLAKREIARRLRTSPSQLARLLDTTNYRKSVDKMLELLAVLDVAVELVVLGKHEGSRWSDEPRSAS